jgi:hypothetical protein
MDVVRFEGLPLGISIEIGNTLIIGTQITEPPNEEKESK